MYVEVNEKSPDQSLTKTSAEVGVPQSLDHPCSPCR